MASGAYYHGTSSYRLESIRTKGFRLREDWSKWLSAKGVYFVLNRPLVALYYAKRAVLQDKYRNIDSFPVVINVPVHITDKNVLNLTTENGMHILYDKYAQMKKQYGTSKAFLTKKDRRLKTIYNANGFSDSEKSDYIDDIINYNRSYKLKWDCAIITDLVNEHDFCAVIAIFQEGLSGALDCFNHEYSEAETPSYQGIRYRDAIMVCVTDLDCIDDEFDIVEDHNFPSEYIEKVTSIAHDRI